MNYLIISDIHGSLHQLDRLLEEEWLFDQRTPVFLGDYVDVGPDSKAVIEILLRLRCRCPDTIFLCGNHDHAMLQYLERSDFVAYAQIGGLATIRAYCGKVYGNVHKQFSDAVPAAHIAFLKSLRSHYETEDHLFSHCGYSPLQQEDRAFETMVLQSHQDLFLRSSGVGKNVVCGHYFQRALSPFVSDRVICLDTGCGIIGGPLTALLLPEKELVQIQTDRSLLRRAIIPG